MKTKTIEGIKHQQEEIKGKGLVWVPITKKSGIEALKEFVKENYIDIHWSSSDLNESFIFGDAELRCVAVNIQNHSKEEPRLGLLFLPSSKAYVAYENWYTVGTHSNWDSFFKALEKDKVEVTEK